MTDVSLSYSDVTIKTLWGWRKAEDTPELMAAWDEYTVEQNPEGWDEECRSAIASWGDDIYAHRYIDLDVSMNKIVQTFQPPTVEAQVSE